jgi:hypothetical protein
MPDILHRISIDAPPQQVHDLIASTGGIARWWTGRPLMQVLTDTPDHVVWRVTDGPDTWIDTGITFTLRPSGHGGTRSQPTPLAKSAAGAEHSPWKRWPIRPTKENR